MTSDKKTVDKARDAFRSSLVAHFRELASKEDLEIDETHLTFAEELGLFVVASGAYQRPAKDGGQNVGLIEITSSRDNLPLYTTYAKKIPPGSFVVHLAVDGTVHLREIGGRLSVPLHPSQIIPKEAGGGNGPLKCTTGGGWYIRITIRGGRICFALACDGTWIIPLGCIRIWGWVLRVGFGT